MSTAEYATGAAGDAELARAIRKSRDGSVAQARLTTDERVLARVTDGIYREPSSALRELISNAYDADASEVVIQTDRPRFSNITIRDDGNGMSPEALARMLRHIGGSAKRSNDGADLNITAKGDASHSPGGRRLIGRIGIGLFSVSQLTQSFQIITKVAGDEWRTVAMVRLRTYDDSALPNESGTEESTNYEAGLVSIWRVPAEDIEAHGTTIVLTELRPHAIKTLQSHTHWQRVAAGEGKPPTFHVGRVEGGRYISGAEDYDALPWRAEDKPDAAFEKLVTAVWAQMESGSVRNPSLEHLCDHYLRTVWALALAAPLCYVGDDPLELTNQDADVFAFSGSGPDAVEPVRAGSLADHFGTAARSQPVGTSPFRVFVDDLELRRPLIFKQLPMTSHALKRPLIFGGVCDEDFGGRPATESGGRLRFSAYILWAPKIAPREHNGILIRVHDASGTLFDRTFMDFQIAERTRLGQLSCEVFVHEGLEAALNIDREGFNEAHPHAQRLASWVHIAVARAINQQKTLANRIRRELRADAVEDRRSRLEELARAVWQRQQRDSSDPPPVSWSSRHRDSVDAILLDPERVLNERDRGNIRQVRTEQIAAIAQVLAAYNLINDMTDQQVSGLLESIAEIIRVEP